MFVDESKERGLLVAAAFVDDLDVRMVRQQMRGLVHKGSHRIHMTKERPVLRRQVALAIAEMPVALTLYEAHSFGRREEAAARAACLSNVVADAAAGGMSQLCLERDDSVEKADRSTLFHAVRQHGVEERLTYRLVQGREEPGLWVADAVAWCWVKGGEWRDLVAPRVVSTNRL